MRNLFFVLFIVFVSGSLAAQNVNFSVGCKKSSLANNPIVQLKFRFPANVVSPYSLNVFRKKLAAGSWDLITKTPLSKAPVITLQQVQAGPMANNNSYKKYQGYMNRVPASNAKEENNVKAIGNLLVLTDNGFAAFAGSYFEDSPATNGETYQNRITDATQADKELAISDPFLVTLNYLTPPSDLTLVQRQQQIYINWIEDSRYYAYKIFKKNSQGSKSGTVSIHTILLGKLTGETVKDLSDIYKYIDTANNLPGSILFYQLSGIDVLGNESALNKESVIQIKDLVAPDSPEI